VVGFSSRPVAPRAFRGQPSETGANTCVPESVPTTVRLTARGARSYRWRSAAAGSIRIGRHAGMAEGGAHRSENNARCSQVRNLIRSSLAYAGERAH
jgi:hypothetical protein